MLDDTAALVMWSIEQRTKHRTLKNVMGPKMDALSEHQTSYFIRSWSLSEVQIRAKSESAFSCNGSKTDLFQDL